MIIAKNFLAPVTEPLEEVFQNLEILIVIINYVFMPDDYC